MYTLCRNKKINGKVVKRIFAALLVFVMISGCGSESEKKKKQYEQLMQTETARDSHVDISELKKINEDIFAWVYVPDTRIDYPVVQNSDGDDYYYISHNVFREEDPKGAIYIEAANLTNMCDFNEVLHGQCPEDGTMFADLNKFLDRSFFDKHPYIYVYTDGNALIYYTFAAFMRNDTRLIQQYDFTYAYGCQAFLDEIYSENSMNRFVRTGWENAVEVDNFIITLSTRNSDDPTKQTVVVGCLVGDVKGVIDRYVDYSDPESEWD